MTTQGISSSWRGFYEELKERRVIRVATLYVILFWPVVQVADILSPALELPAEAEVASVGGRVYLRFDHAPKPLVAQWYRSLRQLFLSRFDV